MTLCLWRGSSWSFGSCCGFFTSGARAVKTLWRAVNHLHPGDFGAAGFEPADSLGNHVELEPVGAGLLDRGDAELEARGLAGCEVARGRSAGVVDIDRLALPVV